MKILIIASEYGDSFGGLALSAFKFQNILEFLGHNVFVEKIDDYSSANIVGGGYDSRLKQKLLVSLFIDDISNKYNDVDCVVAYGGGKNALIASVISTRIGSSFKIILCGSDINLCFYDSSLYMDMQLSLSKADTIIAKSSECIEKAKQINKNEQSHYFVIPNDYDLTKIQLAKERPENIFIVGSTFLNEKKGIANLLHAFGRIKNVIPDFTLKLVGEIDSDIKEKYVEICHQHNITENVLFLGKLKREDYYKELDSSSVYIQSSFFEGCPNAVAEAIIKGKRILLTNTGYFAEVLKDCFPNNIIKGFSIDEMSNSIISFVEYSKNHDERQSIIDFLKPLVDCEIIRSVWNKVFSERENHGFTDFSNGINAVMFHDINNKFSGVDYPKKAFEELVALVKEKGYSLVSMRDYLNLNDKQKLVVCTFDDAYESVYYNAFPILKKYGFTATVFVCSELIGLQNDWNTKDDYIRVHANNDMLLEMASADMEIGSHSTTHHALTRLSETQLEDVLMKSKSTLENTFGGNVNIFCYPYGKFNDYVKHMVSRFYEYAFSVDQGGINIQNDRYQLIRMTPEELKKRMINADIWNI